MTHVAALAAIVAYIAATLLMAFQLWRPSLGGKTRMSALGAFGLGFLFHTVTLVAILQDARFFLLDNGSDYFFWASWGIALVFLLFWRSLSFPIVGAFIIPAVVLFMGCSSYLLHKDSSSLLGTRAVGSEEELILSVLHGVPALISVVSMVLAFIVSSVFIIVERRLKRRKTQALSLGGPNLQMLDTLNKHVTQVGFVAISFVVLSGGLWAVSEQKPIFSADTSVISGIVLWVLLACLLYVRLILKWSPRRVSVLTVMATAFFFMSVFAVLIMAGKFTHASFV